MTESDNFWLIKLLSIAYLNLSILFIFIGFIRWFYFLSCVIELVSILIGAFLLFVFVYYYKKEKLKRSNCMTVLFGGFALSLLLFGILGYFLMSIGITLIYEFLIGVILLVVLAICLLKVIIYGELLFK